MVLDVDLNLPVLSSDTDDEVGMLSHVPAANQQRSMSQVVPIDVDSFDDDVILSSPRAFAQATNNSIRTRSRSNAVDVDFESTSRNASRNLTKRQRIPANQPIIICDSYAVSSENNNLGGSDEDFSGKARNMSPPPPPPPPPEPTFTCSICLGPLDDPTATKCGHIFCRVCIAQAIGTQKKCPTCRRKATLRELIKIYLPAST